MSSTLPRVAALLVLVGAAAFFSLTRGGASTTPETRDAIRNAA